MSATGVLDRNDTRVLEVDGSRFRMRSVGLLGRSDICVLDMAGVGGRMGGVGLSTDMKTDKRSEPKPHEDITYQIIGAAMEVHNQLGPGLKEAFYQRALTSAMGRRGLSVVAEQPIEISIDGTYVGQLYVDHLVEDNVLVECKALPRLLTNDDLAQVITYLNATHKPIGLLINFGRKWLEYKRILPPKNALPWKDRIRRYVWLPPTPISAYPLPKSVDSNRGASQ